ncbi:MAG: hypothetical protein IJ811_01260 [Clostridia bacterium]|nr:hypothetical protein [Clostridia bacterium]
MTGEFTAVSSRVRLARNLDGYYFPCQIAGTAAELTVKRLCLTALGRISDFKVYEMSALGEEQRNSLVEKYLISSALSLNPMGAVAVSKDEKVSVMVGEEDHVREQIILDGNDLVRCYERLNKLDTFLRSNLSFAKKGQTYYTSCPTNLGTGMRASVMLFLPAIVSHGELDGVVYSAKNSGLTVRGAFGEGSVGEGYLFQVSNEVTYGVGERQLISLVENFVSRLIDRELYLETQDYLADKLRFEDGCARAIGVINNCKLLPYNELSQIISQIKIGANVGVVAVTDKKAVDRALVLSRQNTLRLNCVGQREDYARAALVKRMLGGNAVRLK